MIKINSQNDLDRLLAEPYWEDAFLREFYLLSPSYIDPIDSNWIAPDAAPMMLMLICFVENICPGIELLFKDVEDIYFSCRTDLNPKARFNEEIISFYFFGEHFPDIRCKEMYYQFLSQECWNWKVRYGKKNYFDVSGYLDCSDLS
jgi:hypothetical protein